MHSLHLEGYSSRTEMADPCPSWFSAIAHRTKLRRDTLSFSLPDGNSDPRMEQLCLGSKCDRLEEKMSSSAPKQVQSFHPRKAKTLIRVSTLLRHTALGVNIWYVNVPEPSRIVLVVPPCFWQA